MASSPPQHLLVTLLCLTLGLSTFAAAPTTNDEGWKPIADPNDPTVVEIAKYAVNQYDKLFQKNLICEKVVKGESMLDRVGIEHYRLTFTEAGSAPGDYEAIVRDKPSEHYRLLYSFGKVKTLE